MSLPVDDCDLSQLEQSENLQTWIMFPGLGSVHVSIKKLKRQLFGLDGWKVQIGSTYCFTWRRSRRNDIVNIPRKRGMSL